ncbi:MAG TPA: CDP-alcohol phosphatidyltransferase family protein [Acidimicrobiales bacterium]|nr:CDP-alcohol phosphatidyltransferase family protein [Acidimicrobiales bacterium]
MASRDPLPSSRLATLPNLISVARVACAPVFAWLLLAQHHRLAAGAVLAACGASDWVDGWLARHMGQVSRLGQVLDPVADRVLVGTAVVCSLVDGSVPVWLGLLVAGRELLVSAAVVFLAARGAARIDVVWVGKAGTLALMFAFPLFLAGHSDAAWHGPLEVAAWVFALPGLALSWTAAARYLPLARQALEHGRLARAGAPAE